MRKHVSKKLLRCFAAFPSCAVLSAVLADQNWDGDNPIGNFSYTDNWYGNAAPSFGWGGSLWFNYRNNGSQSSVYYDYNSWVQTDNIGWASTFPASVPLNGNGNGLDFNEKIENWSSSPQTVNIPLSGAKNGATRIAIRPMNSDLTFTQPIYNDNSKPYVVEGSNSKTVTFSGSAALVGNSNAHFTIDAASNTTVIMGTNNFTYAGETRVNGGTLLVNGNHTGGGNFIVGTGATLGGTGSIASRVTANSGAFVRPGVSSTPATLSTGNLTLASGSTLRLDANVPLSGGVNVDKLNVTGTVDLTGSNLTFDMVLTNTGVISPGRTFIIIQNDGSDAVSGNFTGGTFSPGNNTSTYTFLSGLLRYSVKYNYTGTDANGLTGNGNDVAVTFDAVPEPTTFGVLAGAIGIAFMRRNRR